MEYVIGLLLSLSVAILAAVVGLDRDRALYPTALIVIASYYVLFARIGASSQTLLMEIAFAIGFSLLAIVGFKRSLLLVGVALIGHGAFDLLHHYFIQNPGVPVWWPGFCMAFDVLFGILLLLKLRLLPPASRN